MKTNACITVFPVFLCVILVVLQGVINHEINKPKYQCGCACVDAAPDGTCRRTECGVEHSTLDQVGSCPIKSPTPWPALVQVPRPESRAVRIASQPFDGLPDPTCRDTGSCPASVLVTGMNRSLAQSMFLVRRHTRRGKKHLICCSIFGSKVFINSLMLYCWQVFGVDCSLLCLPL
jgi:hypothetical protein